jgi:hypothetical protein
MSMVTKDTKWSLGDWHEDKVCVYDDATDRKVCWLQNYEWTQGGADPGQVQHLIKAAPELLAAVTTVSDELGKAINSGNLSWSEEQLFLRWVRILSDSMHSAAGVKGLVVNRQGVVFTPNTMSPTEITGLPK